jgi:hypothetical protein
MGPSDHRPPWAKATAAVAAMAMTLITTILPVFLEIMGSLLSRLLD